MRGITFSSILLLVAAAAHAATITIDPATEYQTIEGFGFFGHGGNVDFNHDDLGVTMVRMEVPRQFESENENGDPDNLELDRFNAGALSAQFALINSYKKFSDVKFIASIWTPPGWMKDMTRDHWSTQYEFCSDGPDACGGHLRIDMYEEFAERCVAFCKLVKQHTGVDLYAFSIQNEAAFIEWYISCVYTPEEYRDVLKVVGARFAREGITARLFGAEDMVEAVATHGRDYAKKIYEDSEAKQYLHAVATHGYSDGINPTSTSGGAKTWGRLGNIAVTLLGKKAWMTETSGFPMDWGGAMTLASNIYLALKYAQLSAWVFWADGTGECSEYGLLCNGQHTSRSLVSKNFYRYIRPDAVMIKCDSDGDEIFPVAFNHKENKTLTIVIVNQGGAVPVTLSSPGLPAQVRKYVTTSDKNCADEGLAGSGGEILLDASSVTTLYGVDYEPAVAAVPRHGGYRGPANSTTGGTILFDCMGRKVTDMSRPGAGVLFERTTESGPARARLTMPRGKVPEN